MNDELDFQLYFDDPLNVSSYQRKDNDVLLVEIKNKNLFKSLNFKDGVQVLSDQSILNFASI